ncbi:MAG: outer membrane lipoprotein chaperone LolA [Candidatus Acidiferrales bacterium]
MKTILGFRVGIAVFAAFFIGFPAVPPIPAQESAVSAKQLAQLLDRHYSHLKTLRATFLQRYNDGPKESRVESGTVYFRRPGQMRWEYESPEKKLFLTDGKTVWFYVPYDRTVTKTAVKDSSDWRTPLALLTGKVDLSRLCSVVDLAEQRGVPPGHSVLRCLPKGEKRETPASQSGKSDAALGPAGEDDFTEVFLEVDSETGELARIEVRQRGGVDLEYRFGGWQIDPPLSKEMFEFQVPRGVAIVNGAGQGDSP